MAASERMLIEILARTNSAEVDRFSKSMDSAAYKTALAAEALERQRKAADASAKASLSLAKADDILKDAEAALRDKVIEADIALRNQAGALDKNKRKTDELAGTLSKMAGSASGFSLGGVAAALSPALIPLAAGIAGGIAQIGVSLGGAGIVTGAFGLLAKQNFGIASAAAEKVQTAQNNYNVAVANGVKPAKAYKAEQIAIGKAYAEMSPQQIALSKQVHAFSDAWQGVQQSTAPVVSGALVPWMGAATKAMQFIKPLITPVAAVFKQWGQDLNRYFGSKKGSEELTRIATSLGKFGAHQMKDIGTFLIDAGRGIANLVKDLAGHNVDFGSFGDHLKKWGDAFLNWSKSAAARKDVGAFLTWMHDNGKTVSSLLKSIATILPTLAVGLTAAGQTELKLITGFLGFVAKLPPGLAKPLADTAGALFLLNKLGLVKVGLKFLGWTFGSGAAAAGSSAAGGAAQGAVAGGLLSKLTPGLKWAVKGGLLIAAAKIALTVAASQAPQASVPDVKHFQKSTPGGVRKFLDFFFGSDVNSANVSAYIKHLFGPAANWGPGEVFSWLRHNIASQFDHIRHDVTSSWGLTWRYVVGSLDQSRHQVAHLTDMALRYVAGSFDQSRHQVAHIWDLTWNNTIGRMQRGFHDVAHGFDDGRHKIAVVYDGVRHDIAHVWDMIWNNTIGRLQRGFHDVAHGFDDGRHKIAVIYDGVRHDIAHAWDIIWNNTIGRIIRGAQDAERAFANLKNWVHDHFLTPLSNFFTRTIPDAFRTAVGSIGRFWANLEHAVQNPVQWVLTHVVGKLFGFIDDVSSFVGLHPNLNRNPTLAAGGKISQGTHETADDVLARVSRNETVVSAAHSRILAPYFAAVGVPGYASGGLVNPIGPGLRPERVDMGVDYGGSGNLYALGSGTITNLWNRNWPGGGFVGLRLNPPYGSGYWYYAEDVIPWGNIHVGSPVSAGQQVAMAIGGNSGIEVGWAAPPGTGQTAAAAAGQQNHNGDPGAFPTAWGVAASNLIGSLGGPRGIVSGPIHGGTAGFGGIIRTLAQIFSGLGNMAKVAIDLAHGDTGGASRALAALLPKGAGGAGGQFGQILTRLPGTLAGEALHFLVSKVKGFAAANQGGGANPAGHVSGSVANWLTMALQFDGKPLSWLPALEQLVTRESGGNPNARNSISVGGQHATGLMQMLPSTFLSFSNGMPLSMITNPIANAESAIRYIASRYGSPSRIPGLFSGTYKGYARGGVMSPYEVGLVGERGPELIRAGSSGATVAPVGGSFHAVIDLRLDGQVIDKQLVKFQGRGGTLQSARAEIRRAGLVG